MVTGPKEFIAGFVSGFEGLLSTQPKDNGNWYDPARYKAGLPQHRNMGVNVGSMRGVTAYALVRYRVRKGIPLDKAVLVSRADMTAITQPMAIDIGYELYYLEPGFDKLPWNRVTASMLDKAWGSGPGTVALMIQTMVGIPAAQRSPNIGPKTVAAYLTYLKTHGEEQTARDWAKMREAKDLAIATNEGPNDPDHVFLAGWNRRTDSFEPGTQWWKTF